MVRLKRAVTTKPGLARRRRGKGWQYLDTDGTPVAAAVKERIDALVIPPAWQNVWICPWANGHIQAIGTDVAGRKQYLYHPDWAARRHESKYQRSLAFGKRLPRARKIAAEHLDSSDLGRDQVLALAFRLLDVGHFRIGGEVYAEENGSFGLATLRRDHVSRENGDTLVFDYTAKSGLQRIEKITDPDVLDVAARLIRRRTGPAELLAYKDGRTWHRIHGEDINAYLKQVTGMEVSAKDFRTWHGTVLAAVAMAREYDDHGETKWTERAKAQAVRRSIVAVSEELGNTPAVCKSSYINPAVVDAFNEGSTVAAAVKRAEKTQEARALADRGGDLRLVSQSPTVERAVLKLLQP